MEYLKRNKNLIIAATLAKIVITAITGFLIYKANVANAEINSSYNQVKTAESSVVYYLDHEKDKKKAYVSAKAFLSYGNSWNDVKVVDKNELAKYADVKLIKSKNNSAIYYINNGKKNLIKSEQEFKSQGYKWSDVVTVNDVDLSEYSENDLNAAGSLSSLSDGLNVKVDVTSPSDKYVSVNTNKNLIMVYNLQAGKETVEIKSLQVKFSGIFDKAAMKNVYIKEAGEMSEKTQGSIRDRYVSFNFIKPILVIPGNEKKLEVYIDLEKMENVINTSFYLETTASDFVTSKNSSISGTFPIKSGVMKMVDGSNLIGKAAVSEISIVSTSERNNSGETIVKRTAGKTNQLIAKYKITELSGKENIKIKSITFSNKGSVIENEVVNFAIKNSANQLVPNKITGNGQNIKLVLNDYPIKKLSEEVFSLYADINAPEGKYINYEISEVEIVGADYNFYVNYQISNISESILVIREKLGLMPLPLKENKNVFKNQAGQLVGVFEIRSDNKKVTIEEISVALENKSLSGKTQIMSDPIVMVNYDTGEIISYKNSNIENKYSFNLNNTKLDSKNNLKVAFIVNIPANVENGTVYKVIIEKISYKSENNLYYTDTYNVKGGEYIATKSDIYIYANENEGELNVINGQKKVKIASFIIETPIGEDVRIKSITFKKGQTSGSVTFDNGFSNLSAYIDGKKLGSISKPYSDVYTFEGLNYKMIDSARKEIKIYADVSSANEISETKFSIENISAEGYTSKGKTTISGIGTDSKKASFGKTEVSVEYVADGSVVKDEKNNLVATYKIKNIGKEKIKLNSLTLTTSDEGFSNSRGYSNLRAVDKISGSKFGKITKPVAKSNQIKLNGSLAVGEEKIVDIYVDAGNIPNESFTMYLNKVDFSGYASKINSYVILNISNNVTYDEGVVAASNTEVITTSNKAFSIKLPVTGIITYNFGDNKSNSTYPYDFNHTGIDIKVNQGTRVKAAADGVVSEKVDSGQGTYYVVISHGADYKTVYGHLSRIDVIVGQTVKLGDTIGLSGGKVGVNGSGQYSTGAHLHFEVQLNEIAVDPIAYVK